MFRNLNRNMAIKKRIFFGFGSAVFGIIITSLIAIFSLDTAYENFKKTELLNNEVALIVESNDIASDLKRNVSIYIFTGHESTYKNIKNLLVELSVSINKLNLKIAHDSEQKEYIKRMNKHVRVYSDTFSLVVKEFEFKERIIKIILPQIFSVLEQSNEKNATIEIQNLIWTYLNSPSGNLSRSVFIKIKALQKNLKNSSYASVANNLNENFLRLTQATRSYLYLTSVVMAGEASEINYVSNNMKLSLINNTTLLKNKIDSQNETIKYALIIFLLFSILAMIFFSWIISAGITRPLSSITRTLEQIISGDIDIEVPEQDRKDEIGTLSKAANIFRERTLSLEYSNAELSQFAYRTSHDLKAPLLSIIGMISIIEEDLNDKEYEEVKLNVEKVSLSAKKLDKLIEDILNLSKVNYLDDPPEECDLFEISKNIELKLETLLTDFDVKFKYESLKGKQITTQKIRLEQVLENLISNSIKYSDPDKSVREVEVKYTSEAGKWSLSIEDNGLGIEENYHSELFGMFKRFHAETAFGSGLGLYLVKKHLAEIHASIQVESTIGKGSIFSIVQND